MCQSFIEFMVLTTRLKAKPNLPPILSFYQFSPVLDLFFKLDWPLISGSTGGPTGPV